MLYAVIRPWYNPMSGKERGNREMAKRKWPLISCILWIAGLAVFITGLNLSGETKEWMKTLALPEHLILWPLLVCPMAGLIVAGISAWIF